jgi:fumarate reductase flavoprotein subunit
MSAVQDVVVIGGGIAGMMAANRAGQLGLKVTVLEQGSEDKYLCNTRFTGGTFHICLREITLDEPTLEKLITESTAGFVPQDLAHALARDGRRVIEWLQAEGIRFMRASASEYHKWVLAPPGRSRPGLDWEGRGGDVLLRTLEDALKKRGGSIVRGARAESLIAEGNRCVGVKALVGGGTEEFRAAAVVIADGGFQGNLDLVRKYISPMPERLKQRGAGNGRGDGMRMALEMGAALKGMDRFYGHVLSRDALTNEQLWPYPYLDSLLTASVVVNTQGQRFVDEGGGGVFVANAVAQLADPMSSLCIFDSDIWEQPGRNGLIPANPHLEKCGATMHKADDIASLAAKAGIPATTLEKTIADYNAAVTRGSDNKVLPLTPQRRIGKFKALPIVKAPFYALPMVAGITYTMGGIAVNAHSQALREDGTRIDGLYAVGASTGGLEGGPQIGYVGGLAKGGVTGLNAADHIAAEIGGK